MVVLYGYRNGPPSKMAFAIWYNSAYINHLLKISFSSWVRNLNPTMVADGLTPTLSRGGVFSSLQFFVSQGWYSRYCSKKLVLHPQQSFARVHSYFYDSGEGFKLFSVFRNGVLREPIHVLFYGKYMRFWSTGPGEPCLEALFHLLKFFLLINSYALPINFCGSNATECLSMRWTTHEYYTFHGSTGVHQAVGNSLYRWVQQIRGRFSPPFFHTHPFRFYSWRMFRLQWWKGDILQLINFILEPNANWDANR